MPIIIKSDWIQIILNLIAFFILYSFPTGRGSFWGFTTFFILSLLILIEILLSKDKTALWIWITKTFTYFILFWKFSSNIGPFHWEYVAMIFISFFTFMISRKIIKERAIAMWGTNISYLIGAVMYIIAVVKYPKDYGNPHLLFWLISCISYGVLIYDIIKQKKEKVNLIIPIYAFTICIIYMLIIYYA